MLWGDQRGFALCFLKSALLSVVFFAAVPLLADHIGIVGGMGAPMSQDESRTFTVDFEFRTAGFNGKRIVTVNASFGLDLGKSTLNVPFNCTEQSLAGSAPPMERLYR